MRERRSSSAREMVKSIGTLKGRRRDGRHRPPGTNRSHRRNREPGRRSSSAGSSPPRGSSHRESRRSSASPTIYVAKEIGEFSVVQADSHDAATKIFGKDHPHLQMPGAWIEIVESMPVPGM